MIKIKTSQALLAHLSSWTFDGSSVAEVLFDGNRLSYPSRKMLETELGYIEPYTLELEARTIEGLSRSMAAAIRLLSHDVLAEVDEIDQTLELLWRSHDEWSRTEVSLDRLVAALVMVQIIIDKDDSSGSDIVMTPTHVDQSDAAFVLIEGLYRIGFPPTRQSLEEIFDGAPPACVGLGLVEI